MKRVAYLLILILSAFSCSRLSTAYSIKQISSCEDFNLYEMNVNYDYDLDKIISNCSASDSSYLNAVVSEILPFLSLDMKMPNFGCSSFNMLDNEDNHYKMGRNYDFRRNTSAMLVRSHPKNGYSSIAIAALENIKANKPDSSLKTRMISLASPFACLDGINEKGVSISVLMLNSKPTRQNTGKPVLHTSMVIRLVLDRAATTEEAVELLKQYDIFSSAGGDYHFYITDPSGDGRVVEFNPKKEHRDLIATRSSVVTNFYMIYKDSTQSCHKDGIFNHGRDRYVRMDSIFSCNAGNLSSDVAWNALRSVSKPYNPKEKTSNTQWSALYDNTACSVSVVLRRDWPNIYNFSINH